MKSGIAVLLLLIFFTEIAVSRNNTVHLPHPSGSYGVARIAYDWIDNTRFEIFSSDTKAHRELMAYIWYPTQKNLSQSTFSGYLPNADVLAKELPSAELESDWGASWQYIFSNQVLTDVHEKAPIASGRERYPLIVFSPGLGTSTLSYTCLIQEIVSHGYIVASIEPIYESSVVAFPDGRVIRSVPEAGVNRRVAPEESRAQFLDRMRKEDAPLLERRAADIRFRSDGRVIRSVPEAGVNRRVAPEESRAQFLDRMRKEDAPLLERRAADIRFVINQLFGDTDHGKRISPNFPFANRIDFHNIGVWGHSVGGRAAARACQLDIRIKACLNADGGGLDGPIFLYEGARLPSQPFMLMQSPLPLPPTDSMLTMYKITREDWEKEHNTRLTAYEQQLKAFPGGSYRLTINMPGTSHNSFTDWQILGAKSEADFSQGSQILGSIEIYTIAFFDKYLKHRSKTLLDTAKNASAGIFLEKYKKKEN